jgi:hypothetical protein
MDRLFVPTSIHPSGRKVMSVVRQDRSRVIGFRRFEDAQAALGDGPFYHVMAELLSQQVEGVSEGGEPIVWETTAAGLAEAYVHVDVCEFVHPHFLDVRETIVAGTCATESDQAYLEKVFLSATPIKKHDRV